MSIHVSLVTAFLLGGIVAVSAANTINVGQHGLSFTRSSASLARGDQMIFTNEDDVIHNIHIFGPADGESKDLGLQKPGVPLTTDSRKPVLTGYGAISTHR
jgi:plastocyanin